MKKITVMIPCYNEVENVEAISQAVIDIFEQDETLKKYAFDIQFIDNCSVDGTRDKLEEICAREKRVKAIFNVKNFGQFNSPFYGMLQAECDALVLLCADFQDPVELIPTFVKEWENGYKIVCGIKRVQAFGRSARAEIRQKRRPAVRFCKKSGQQGRLQPRYDRSGRDVCAGDVHGGENGDPPTPEEMATTYEDCTVTVTEVYEIPVYAVVAEHVDGEFIIRSITALR